MTWNTRTGFALLAAALTGSAVACSGTSDPNPVVDEGDWNATSATDDHDSTHLWIVNNAMRIAAKHADLAPVKTILETMNGAVCKAQWQQGLLDADYKAIYNQARVDMKPDSNMFEKVIAGATWESHFYDPDTGLNYKGAKSPKTALTETLVHLRSFVHQTGFAMTGSAMTGSAMTGGAVTGSATTTACYELGLSLHYFTDMTQPMHTANFTAVNRPFLLHSNLEMYAQSLQSRFELADWSGAPTFTADDAGASAFAKDSATVSKALWIPGIEAVVHAYGKHTEKNWVQTSMCFLPAKTNAITFLTKQARDNIKCWQGDPEVDAAVGRSISLAQDRTAQLLFLVGKMIAQEPNVFPPLRWWIAAK
jgi:hypothetical protein